MSSPERKKRKKKDPALPLTPNPSLAHDLLSPERKRRRKRKREPAPPLTPNPSLAHDFLSPERKRRRNKKKKLSQSPTPQSTPSPSLPHDLLLICIARVSRLYYPTLSLVSKSFRSLIASPELYKARSRLGHTESCLYVCVESVGALSPTWYTLCRKPNTNSGGYDSGGYVLAKVSIPNSPGVLLKGLVAVGSNIYNIGGSDVVSMANRCYSRVSILDCRSNTLSEAPSLRAPLCSLSASVVDGKIYVSGCSDGGDRDSDLKNAFQVLDTKAEAQVWDYLPSGEMEVVVVQRTACLEGKFHFVTGDGVVAYDPKEGKWDAAGRRMGWYMDSGACCEIDKVLYSASSSDRDGGVVFVWYDTKKRKWRNVMGLVGLPKLTCKSSNVRVADYGGKMGVMWEEESFLVHPWGCFHKKEIWCAEIALERRNSCNEIWGKVEWLDRVLTVRGRGSSFKLVKVLAATV